MWNCRSIKTITTGINVDLFLKYLCLSICAEDIKHRLTIRNAHTTYRQRPAGAQVQPGKLVVGVHVRPHIRIGIKRQSMDALIDSGSVRTLMNVSMYERLKLPPPTRSAPDLVTLTGTTVPTAGVIDVCMNNGITLYKYWNINNSAIQILVGTVTIIFGNIQKFKNP